MTQRRAYYRTHLHFIMCAEGCPHYLQPLLLRDHVLCIPEHLSL